MLLCARHVVYECSFVHSFVWFDFPNNLFTISFFYIVSFPFCITAAQRLGHVAAALRQQAVSTTSLTLLDLARQLWPPDALVPSTAPPRGVVPALPPFDVSSGDPGQSSEHNERATLVRLWRMVDIKILGGNDFGVVGFQPKGCSPLPLFSTWRACDLLLQQVAAYSLRSTQAQRASRAASPYPPQYDSHRLPSLFHTSLRYAGLTVRSACSACSCSAVALTSTVRISNICADLLSAWVRTTSAVLTGATPRCVRSVARTSVGAAFSPLTLAQTDGRTLYGSATPSNTNLMRMLLLLRLGPRTVTLRPVDYNSQLA
jgi:hypothetical protein